MLKRGIRNNNPCNVEDAGIPWNGILPPAERSPEQRFEKRFVVFRHPVYGLRATAIILRNYQRWYSLATPFELIDRYAPEKDNNPTSVYAEFVATALEIPVNHPLNLEDFDTVERMLAAMTLFENGRNPYTWEIPGALLLAEFAPPLGDYSTE